MGVQRALMAFFAGDWKDSVCMCKGPGVLLIVVYTLIERLKKNIRLFISGALVLLHYLSIFIELVAMGDFCINPWSIRE